MIHRVPRGLRALPGAALLGLASFTAQAGALVELTQQSFTDYCSRSTPLTARQQARLLRLAEIVRQELEQSGHPIALVSRSGLNLQRLNQRYSHAGLSLREGAELPWAVRQLYYACDEKRPRLFDQGLAGFVMGTDSPGAGHLSVLLLPDSPPTRALRRAALDRPLALGLLSATYSANAYAFSSRYQNCNQWVAELMGAAWGGLPAAPAEPPLRERAQTWLRQAGYKPQPVDIGSHALMIAAAFMPMVHLDDHPEADRFALRLQVSLPEALERFTQQQVPGAQRIELCHAEGRLVLRRDGPALPDSCQPAAGDTVLPLD